MSASASESSPSPDGHQNVDKARKNRKPDMQLYVPRGKRLENEAKQLNQPPVPPPHQQYVQQKSAKSSAAAVVLFENGGRGCKSSEEISSPPTPLTSPKIIYPSSSSSTFDPTKQRKSADDGIRTRWMTPPSYKMRGKSVDKECSVQSCRQNNSFYIAQQDSRSNKRRFQPTVPAQRPAIARPDPSKLPQNQIYEMLKKYNIAVVERNTKSDDDVINSAGSGDVVILGGGGGGAVNDFSSSAAADVFPSTMADDFSSAAETYEETMNEESFFQDKCSRSNTGNQIFTSSAPIAAVPSTTDPVDFFRGNNGGSPFSPSATINNNLLLNKSSDADFILSSLPKSYDEFESKDLHKTFFIHQQQQEQQHSSSYSPSCGSPGAFVFQGPTASSSPSMIDPDDLEVQLINESFEEQLKQAQVLSNAKVKEAFYRQPNLIPNTVAASSTTASSNNNNGETATVIRQPQQQIVPQLHEQIPPQRPLRVIENKVGLSLKPLHSPPAPQPQPSVVVGDHGKSKPGLTWAGWGSGVTGSGQFSSRVTEKPSTSNDSSSTSQCPLTQHKKSLSGSLITSSSSSTCSLTLLNDSKNLTGSCSSFSLDPSFSTPPTSLSATSSSINHQSCMTSTNIKDSAAADENLDILSKAMIEQVLLGEEDDDCPKVPPLIDASSLRSPAAAGSAPEAEAFSTAVIMETAKFPAAATPIAVTTAELFASFADFSQTSAAPAEFSGTAAPAEFFRTSSATTATAEFSASPGSSAVNNPLPLFVPSALTVLNDGYVNDASPGRKASNSSVVDLWEDIDANFIPDFAKAVNDAGLESPPPPTIDYLKFNFKEPEFNSDELCHVLEAYDFSPALRTENLHAALHQNFNCKLFTIEWVDETHALIVLADKHAAQLALQGKNPVLKLRPLCQASVQSKKKAKANQDSLRPYKPRPETSVFLARRLVESHLGKKADISQAARNQERMKITKARENKRVAAQLREDAWEGKL